ncbi:hypothetical protein F511_17754 [Dorcoceras hygrometricum]|uniref:Uncharacterized protein n=1 Tax=Dorcoceras hygrometricum TaxID=472368 RepID=A0A2Z7BMX1_9LAMI|nr:hypothetical protein F511_17754 [Dorcoceras hygrometricum]
MNNIYAYDDVKVEDCCRERSNQLGRRQVVKKSQRPEMFKSSYVQEQNKSSAIDETTSSV